MTLCTVSRGREVGRVLYLVHLGVILWWLLDRTAAPEHIWPWLGPKRCAR